MSNFRNLLTVLAVFACGLDTASAVEELQAPANAVPDDVLLSEGTPVSPYDAVPHELDPAVEVYSQPAPLEGVSVYSPAPAMEAPLYAAPAFAQPLTYVAPAQCCTAPKIRYWNHPLLADDVCPCDCNETIETHVEVPCQCCPVAVKVCVPVCCVGAPSVDVSRDLLGRKTYEYCWACGYRIKIVDRHTGTLVVHTFNR